MAKSEPRTPIIGVGASAGGVEALEGFFGGIPEEPGFGVVIVTHLSPDRESHLQEILARHTALSVQSVKHDVEVKANCVYVLSAEALVGIEKGRLQVRDAPVVRRERKPIDIFLSALAKDLGEYSGAVILSGGDGDGALGVKAVKERGGITLAQIANGDGPSHPGMPDSAISTGFVDFAVPAHEMGAKLVEFAHSLKLLDGLAADEKSATERVMDQGAREDIYAILRNQVGHDFSGYKPRTFLRRVQRRMQVAQLATIESYIEHLRQDQREVHALFRDLLINVTNFFRDGDAFEKLKQLVIPKLFENRGADDTVRIWVPGCATGEEVFSIAMLVREHLDTLRGQPRVQIFATDIDEHSLQVARAARYPEPLLDTVSPERLARFFIKDAGSYVVSKDVRDLCIFSPHSVIRDPPFSRIDLISCRNLLIYFGPDVQSQVVPTFHYSLREGGYLFLGTSENVSQFTDLFVPLEKKHRIFRARADATAATRVPMTLAGPQSAGTSAPPRLSPARGLALRQSIESQVIDRFSPPHVVANREGDIVFYSSRTGRYLEAVAGAPTRQLFSLARKSLRLDLRGVFREAVETGRSTTRNHVGIDDDEGRVQFVSVRVEPLNEGHTDEPLYIVLFYDEGGPVSREEAARDANDGASAAHVEAELRETRDRLQSVVEEYETALEELKSSNEEMVSVNEELQSTNEELEASKEELQSLNEELHTVNAELNNKVESLDAANSDLSNLFENTQVATIFLDRALKIRTFTPALAHVFNILPGDRGRPLTDLASATAFPDLAADIKAALENGDTKERRIEQKDARRAFLIRTAPYRDRDDKIEGAVVTFVDVTTLVEAEAHQQVLIAELNHRVKNMLAVVIGLATQLGKEVDDLPEFQEGFSSRLQAMARAYELLSLENWSSAAVEDLVARELAPFSKGRVELSGEGVRLGPPQALALSMIVHELATNAAKHGALADSKGRVAVSWTREGERFVFNWREIDGPPAVSPQHPGFGLRLVDREARYSLRGESEIRFLDTGLEALIAFRASETETENA
jgi:two-component system CheB/CheR fusion protein